ncbi:MAG: methyl-accepting chemotaxis protein [Candidatus Cloacimonetes bacterium]|nr:methyl-accepting chemotaxis protein [Candidatus Cloacimonadota bacterium]
MLKKMNINAKVICYVIVQFVLLTLVLLTFSVVRMNTMTKNITNDMFLEKLDGDLNSLHKYVRSYYGNLSWQDYTLVDSSGKSIEGDFSMVDAIFDDKNVSSTIFVKQGVEFKRISTTVRNNRNERIIGTILEPGDPTHSAKASLLRGERFIGKISVFGEMYLTGYLPMLDENNEVYGAFFVGLPIDTVNEKIGNETYKTFIYVSLVSAFLILLFIIIMYNVINHLHEPIKKTINLLKGFTEADTNLKKRLEIDSHDEMGELAFYFNKILDEIYTIVVLIITNANNVQKKSIELSSTARQLLKKAMNMNDQYLKISASTEEINLNTIKIINFAENSSSSVAAVASSSEELTSIINNLAVTTEQTNANVNNIMDIVHMFETTIEETGEDILTLVKDIHSMSDTIEMINNTFGVVVHNSQLAHDKSNYVNNETESMVKEIQAMKDLTSNFAKTAKNMNSLWEQGNFLVFNLSLEAGRMGDSGRGFIAAISELKEIRKEFADYLDDIIKTMENIQSIASSTNLFVNNIVENLGYMNKAIISSISEQNFTIEEITKSQQALSIDANNADIKITNLVEYAKNIITYVNQAVLAFGDITQNSYNSAKSSNEITNKSVMANQGVSEISKVSDENTNILKDISKNMNLMQFEIHATTLQAENTKKVSEDLNRIAKELKQLSNKFLV